MVDLVDIKQKYVHFALLLQTENQCPIQFLSWKCKCGCKLSEKLHCLMLLVNASTCMRVAVAFISPLGVTDMYERHGWAECKVASDGRMVRASRDTQTHTRHSRTHTHTGLLTVTFDVKVEATDIYAGGFIKVGPEGSSRGKDHRERI